MAAAVVALVAAVVVVDSVVALALPAVAVVPREDAVALVVEVDSAVVVVDSVVVVVVDSVEEEVAEEHLAVVVASGVRPWTAWACLSLPCPVLLRRLGNTGFYVDLILTVVREKIDSIVLRIL